MVMQKLLTIVVPTYNMQDYLNRCLDSLVLSPELMEQLEVLVVNDGSKDNSSVIAHEYGARYPETFRVIDKDNGNYGSCVNRGLAEAQGKYIKILDADDWFDNRELAAFLMKLKDVDVDLVLTNYQVVNPEGQITQYMSYPMSAKEVFNFQDYSVPGVYFAMHSITYRTEMLRNINYKQTEGISYTDTEWVYYPQHGLKTCIYLPFDIYRYVVGRKGQTMDPIVIAKSIGQYDKLLREMIKFADNLPAADKQLYSYQRLNDQIEHLSLGVYRNALIKQDDTAYDNKLLQSFDEMLRVARPNVWEEAGKLTIKKHFPIHYVRYWRKHGKRFSIGTYRDFYRKIRYGKQ